MYAEPNRKDFEKRECYGLL